MTFEMSVVGTVCCV